MQELRHSAACGSLAHDLGKRFASLVLDTAVAVLGGKFLGVVADALRGEADAGGRTVPNMGIAHAHPCSGYRPHSDQGAQDPR